MSIPYQKKLPENHQISQRKHLPRPVLPSFLIAFAFLQDVDEKNKDLHTLLPPPTLPTSPFSPAILLSLLPTHPFPIRRHTHTHTRVFSSKPAPSAPEPSRELNILLLDRDPLGVDGAEVGVLEQVHHEGLAGFLQRLDGLRLPAEGLAANGHKGKGDFTDLWNGMNVC